MEIPWKVFIVRTSDIYHENDAIVQITVGENAIIKVSLYYKSQADSEEKSLNTTTVFREIPSIYWLVLFATDENQESYKEGNSDMPLSVAEMLETLTNSNDCQFIHRKHINGENNNGELNEFRQSMPSNHSHILFHLPQFSGAEKLIK